jgi:predicted GNAT family acetyltransferase
MRVLVTHSPAKCRFECRLGNDTAVCEYALQSDVWKFTHTYVPESMRGQGVAAALVRYALEHVKVRNGKVVAVCSYVAGYIARHSEYSALLLDS